MLNRFHRIAVCLALVFLFYAAGVSASDKVPPKGANGPGAGKGRDWKKPAGHSAIAQLSPWVLWPPELRRLRASDM